MGRVRWVRYVGRVALAVGWVCLLLVSASLADARGLYRFIDDRGVVHFSDNPADDRFQRIAITPAGMYTKLRLVNRIPIFVGYDPLIARTARAYGVDPALVKAVIAAESAFDYRAVSRRGAQGLMQLMPTTADRLGVEDAFRPEENVLGGVRYLREMFDRFGDVTRTLAAYNAGPEAVARYKGIPPYRETQTYVARVLDYYRRYHGDFER